MDRTEAMGLIMDASPYGGRQGQWRFWREFLLWLGDTGRRRKWPIEEPFDEAEVRDFLARPQSLEEVSAAAEG